MLRKRVGIVLFDEVEVLDFCGPLEVFSAVRLCEESRRQQKSPFETVLIPHYTFLDCPELDILVVPGGWGTRKEISNEILLAWLAEQAKLVELVVSVCTGSLLLGFAGLLNGCRATTHWRSLEWMRTALPNVIVDDTKHFILDGKVWTSAGISAGIDMALKVVDHYHGEEIARVTARHMEYPYPETDERRIDLGL
jgi:transcriptional regulator GlxA family with amidase domain